MKFRTIRFFADTNELRAMFSAVEMDAAFTYWLSEIYPAEQDAQSWCSHRGVPDFGKPRYGQKTLEADYVLLASGTTPAFARRRDRPAVELSLVNNYAGVDLRPGGRFRNVLLPTEASWVEGCELGKVIGRALKRQMRGWRKKGLYNLSPASVDLLATGVRLTSSIEASPVIDTQL